MISILFYELFKLAMYICLGPVLIVSYMIGFTISTTKTFFMSGYRKENLMDAANAD